MTNNIRKTIPIKGMHCRSCEIVIEDELKKISGIKNVIISEKKGTAEIFSAKEISDGDINDAVSAAGYSVGKNEVKWISTDIIDYKHLLYSAGILLFLFLIFRSSGVADYSFTKSSDYSKIPVVFLVGLTAGLSTCMALVGGIVLAVSARFSEKHKNLKPAEKFIPHIYFNLGRVLFFALFGGILGFVGSALQFSTTTLGYLTVFVGAVMLLMGIQTIGLFPILSKIRFTLPKSINNVLGISKKGNNEYSHSGALIAGGLTFFLPCGFTQVMQLFAMSSGSLVTGAITMSVFALGTTPGLLGIGGLTSWSKGSFTKPLFKFVGLLVIMFSFYNIQNGLNLTGVNLSNSIASAEGTSTNCSTDMDPEVAKAYEEKYGTSLCTSAKPNSNNYPNGASENQGVVQILKAVYTARDDMRPASFTVEVGKPVRMEVEAKDDGYGCMGSLALPGLVNKYEVFRKGKTVVMEFTPTKKGKYQITCAMGVPRGTLTVQ